MENIDRVKLAQKLDAIERFLIGLALEIDPEESNSYLNEKRAELSQFSIEEIISPPL